MPTITLPKSIVLAMRVSTLQPDADFAGPGQYHRYNAALKCVWQKEQG